MLSDLVCTYECLAEITLVGEGIINYPEFSKFQFVS